MSEMAARRAAPMIPCQARMRKEQKRNGNIATDRNSPILLGRIFPNRMNIYLVWNLAEASRWEVRGFPLIAQ